MSMIPGDHSRQHVDRRFLNSLIRWSHHLDVFSLWCRCLCLVSARYLLKISPQSNINPQHLSYFHFVGRVLGLAVKHAHYIEGAFVMPVYKMLLGKPVSLNDMEQVDQQFHGSLYVATSRCVVVLLCCCVVVLLCCCVVVATCGLLNTVTALPPLSRTSAPVGLSPNADSAR